MTLRRSLRLLLRHGGLDVTRWPTGSPAYERSKLIAAAGIGVIFDVGANSGQYGDELRRFGFSGPIHSFEPLPEAFEALQARASDDHFWFAHRVAVGAADGEAVLNVAANSVSSSLRGMEDLHLEAAPASRYVGTTRVQVVRLDAVGPGLARGATCMLKIDVQGAERDVLEGAEGLLSDIALFQVEVSLAPLYGGGMTLSDLLIWAEGRGLAPVRLEPGFTHTRVGRTLQCDLFLGTPETCARLTDGASSAG